MSNRFERDPVLHPEPSPAEFEAARIALVRTRRPELPGAPEISVWRAAGIQESVDRDPQEAEPRSNPGAARA
jgi:hypothetical protein